MVVAAVALASARAAAASEAIADFAGTWQGVEVNVEAAEPAPKLAPGDLNMTLTEQDSGFRIRGFALGREADGTPVARPLDATFAPTGVPGMFAFAPDSGSLLSSLFADPAVGNPLEGDTLLWARLQDDALHVYSLAIDRGGGFALEHSIGRLTGNGMVARYQLRSQNDRVVTVEGRLERTGD
jgi:hypothetical protein